MAPKMWAMLVLCTFVANAFASQNFGESLVSTAINKAKETVCKTKTSSSQAMRLYQAAVEKLGSILENGKSALSEYLEGQVQKKDTVTGAYEALKSLKDALVSTGSEVNSAFSNLGSAQTYVVDAQRWLMSVYNDFMDKLRIAGLGDGDFVEDFKGKNARDVATSEGPENAPSNEQRRDSDVESDKDGDFEADDIYSGLQDAYERVSQAAAMALEKAYTKINDLSKEAMKAATGSDDLSDLSLEKAQQAVGDMKQKAADVLGKAKDAAVHLAGERGGEEPSLLQGEEDQTKFATFEDTVLSRNVPASNNDSIETIETATSFWHDPERQNGINLDEE
ncbi:unnamed protein product [Enterobius vermicularis]|uniref:DUF725 domain-containing protein n=1 Tax=Enterobius vermicularis TaxID=51028 RepID=A0A0N4UV72_ENTVE|nr:unnamed protein product [Enterobius vermicularis]